MKLYTYNIILLLKRLLLALLLFLLCRVFFFIYNIGLFSNIDFWQLIKIVFVGMRFDLSVIVYFNFLFIIAQLLPLGRKITVRPYQLALKLYFVFVNSILVLGNLGDSVFFHYVQKRSTADIYKFIFLSNDVLTLLPGFIIDYWFVGIIWIAIIALTWMLYPDINKATEQEVINSDKGSNKTPQIIYKLTVMIVLLGFSVIGARGGLQLKPLSIIDASKYVPASQMPLVLNSVFTTMTTYGHDDLTAKEYFSPEIAEKIYPVVNQFDYRDNEFTGKNVVILLLESFSKEYVGSLNNNNGYTPFLDSLMKYSLSLENAYSNGLRSIDAIPAIVTGIPSLMNDPFITSVYNTNKSNSLAVMLKKEGYYTAFFHGGTNGTMNFDGFAGYAGFEDYYGRFEYNNDEDYDGYWGIYDEPFLQYFAQKLNSFKEPFFAFEFTLSSHYPYSIPKKHRGEFPEGALKIHKVVRYSDYALKQFFKTASNMPWYNNTLFIIAADHPAQSVIPNEKNEIEEAGDALSNYLTSYYKNTSGRYAIPVLIFNPGDKSFSGKYTGTVQQTDIFPTVLDYLKYNKPFVSFGSSIFNDGSQRIALQFVNGLYQITSGKYSLLFDGNNSTSLYDNDMDPRHKKNLVKTKPIIVDSLETTIKATLQEYLTRMINNDLTVVK